MSKLEQTIPPLLHRQGSSCINSVIPNIKLLWSKLYSIINFKTQVLNHNDPNLLTTGERTVFYQFVLFSLENPRTMFLFLKTARQQEVLSVKNEIFFLKVVTIICTAIMLVLIKQLAPIIHTQFISIDLGYLGRRSLSGSGFCNVVVP